MPYILSAKYRLIDLNQVIEPYNKTLNTMKKEDEIKKWLSLTYGQLLSILLKVFHNNLYFDCIILLKFTQTILHSLNLNKVNICI